MKKLIIIIMSIFSMLACKKEENTISIPNQVEPSKGEMTVAVDGKDGYSLYLNNCKVYIDTVRFSTGLVKSITIISENEDIQQNEDFVSIVYYCPYTVKINSDETKQYKSGLEESKGIHASRKKDGIRTSTKLSSATTLYFTTFTKDKISGNFEGTVFHQSGNTYYNHKMNISFTISGKNIKSFIN